MHYKHKGKVLFWKCYQKFLMTNLITDWERKAKPLTTCQTVWQQDYYPPSIRLVLAIGISFFNFKVNLHMQQKQQDLQYIAISHLNYPMNHSKHKGKVLYWKCCEKFVMMDLIPDLGIEVKNLTTCQMVWRQDHSPPSFRLVWVTGIYLRSINWQRCWNYEVIWFFCGSNSKHNESNY